MHARPEEMRAGLRTESGRVGAIIRTVFVFNTIARLWNGSQNQNALTERKDGAIAVCVIVKK